jgi:anti-sigma regulatory factor (Ser/Thr protein kinase)
MDRPVDLDIELPRAQAAPGLARRALKRQFTGRLDSESLIDAQLMASELVSNALAHGEGEIGLRASLDEDRLRVEVTDQGGGFAHELRRDEFEQVGGWGLGIVDDLSSRWGVHEGSSHVWFELERSGPRLSEPEDRPDDA